MNGEVFKNGNSKTVVWAAVALSVALILCALIIRSTIIKVKGFGQTLSVTGAAFKPITSDFAIWEVGFSASAPSVEAAFAKMKRDLELVKAFFKENGFGETAYRIGSVQVNRNFDQQGQPTGFTLVQSVTIELADVEKISRLAKQSSALVEKGVELNSQSMVGGWERSGGPNPRYIFTKLEDLKVELIKAATENARLRAEQLAQTTGKKVGAPVSARIGVFQIRPLHSQEVSDYGVNDMSSIEKEIVSTVNISFLIE